MTQITTQLSDELTDMVEKIAKREGSSKSEFVRRAAIHYLKREYPEDYQKVIKDE